MKTGPRCVIVTGRPGSGKTTLARHLSALLHMPMLSRDQIKEGYVSTYGISHEKLPADTNQKVTDVFLAATQSLLESNVSVVVEAAFQHQVWETTICRWADIANLYFIICETDPNVCARRHLDRGLENPEREFYHGDNRVKVFKETGEFLAPAEYATPSFDVPTLRVSTFDGYLPDLPDIEKYIMKTIA